MRHFKKKNSKKILFRENVSPGPLWLSTGLKVETNCRQSIGDITPNRTHTRPNTVLFTS